MSGTPVDMAAQAAKAGEFPQEFNKREKKMLESVKHYVDASAPTDVITSQGDLIVGNMSGSPARLALGSSGLPLVAGASTVSYAALGSAALGAGSVLLAALGSGIAPSHIVKFAGKHTTTGGSASEAFTVSGVLSSDIVFVTLQAQGVTPRTVLTAAPTSNTITVVFSGDPSSDHVVSYQVLRAAS